ncbi:tail fiber domain-containing protein [Chryseobacterium sp. JM1]|uniref:tail fiber domain-containing protein n=1 Tax=Chryseobacterium sp. JM1 TaxID=1233950 RepID=UPI0004E73C4C|nr:tail fiber domain-containing protein [Chryseobacterium sp. JM1]KFF18690.1 hypothetical protein IW22_18500 [Chryseobacterium sp. JM1]
MKKTNILLCLLFLSSAAFSASAQVSLANVWTGTTIPSTTAANVGVGTTAPAAKVDIISSGPLPALKIKNVVSLFGNNATNISEVYTQTGNVIPAMDPIIINWLGSNGVFGLRSLSNTANESRMMYNDNLGNLKSSNLTMYSSPTFGNGTSINSIRGIAYLSFLNGGNGSTSGFGTVSGGANGIYMARLGVGVDASSTYDLDVFYGSVRAQAFVLSSDKKLKDNIMPLKDLSSKLLNIKPYSYTFKSKEGNTDKRADNDKLHFGFIAQEVEKEFPNLVTIDEKGNYALNYIEFIPLLLNELKEQKSEIKDLKERMAALEVKINGVSETKKTVSDKPSFSSFSLEQNVPNPFNQETVIRFNAAGENVSILVYDMGGRQLQSIPVKRGEKQTSISARTLTPGTYIYNLQADGKLIDSKKMIVTH